MEYSLIRLTDRLEVKAQAAAWFHAKWGVPEQAYLDSMDDALREAGPVPQWYLVLESSRIIGGMGVIENDFHDRKDLTPNVCAVYTEPDRRCRGIAGALLQFVCRDMHEKGIDTLYLLTDHTGFYERYGWNFSAWPRATEKKFCRGCMCTDTRNEAAYEKSQNHGHEDGLLS